MSISDTAADIHATLEEHGEAPVALEEIEERLDTMVNDYQVPLEDASTSVLKTVAREAGMDVDAVLGRGSGDGPTPDTLIADLDGDGVWVTLPEVKVVERRETRHENMVQNGILGDESGTTFFTVWDEASESVPDLEEGKAYRIEGAVTSQYQDNTNIKLTSTTDVEEIGADIEVGDNTLEVTGCFVDIQDGSGLIKRCTEEDCTRVLNNGRCSEHDDVDGEWDMRIKGVVDTGTETVQVVFGREQTEELTGMSLEEAQQIAQDEMDREEPMRIMASHAGGVIGRYLTVRGPRPGYLLVEEFERARPQRDADELLTRARSI